MTCWEKELNDLKQHPFTIIGLSDKEKFHTGMLAHAIRYFWNRDGKEKRLNLIEILWGKGAFSHEFSAFNPKKIHPEVEQASIDLIVELDEQNGVFAEVKFKTTLHSDQMTRYAQKKPKHKGIILGLFEETDEEQLAGFKTVCFPEKIVDCFNDDRYKELLVGEDDNLVIIRIWINYLRIIRRLQSEFQKSSTKLNEIPDPEKLRKGLDAIKLKGIFERFRYHLVNKDLITSGIASELFNSNGNAGIHIKIDTPNKKYSYGLQWQSGALKLFIESETKKDAGRDSTLNDLANSYYGKFYGGITKEIKLNRDGKFRSVTVEHWDIMKDSATRAEEINARLKFLQAISLSL